MPGLPRLSLVEGSFEELSLEFATFLDNAKGENSSLVDDITPLLADAEKADAPQETKRDEVLKKLVGASNVLNQAPERELAPAYNMLIHLVAQSDDPDPFLARICKYLTTPITSSSHNSAGLALSVLSNLFNTVQPDDETRYHVLLTVVEAIKNSGNFETLLPQLKNLEQWVEEWDLEDDSAARKLYLAISDAAVAAKGPEQSYLYLLKALKTIKDDSASTEAHDLSVRALKLALLNDKHFDFQDLTALDSIQALRTSDQTWSELLELFSAETFEDFQDFKQANSSFLQDNELDEAVLDRKMRQLTLASLSAQAASTRTLPYAQIAKALQIETKDVEMWVIDSIRSGLVEGKLSQQKQEFLIHRSTYRVFGENQWREVASRLETWRASLRNVLAVIQEQKKEFVREKEQEISGQGVQNGQGYRPSYRQRNQPERSQQQAVEVE